MNQRYLWIVEFNSSRLSTNNAGYLADDLAGYSVNIIHNYYYYLYF